MLADIVVRLGVLVNPRVALVTGVRHVLLVLRPADSLSLEEVDDSGDIASNLVEVIVVHAKVVATY